ncbi:MAG TPA: hypothetical protein VII71_01315, partial [Verrucomicrobiae bacterium]
GGTFDGSTNDPIIYPMPQTGTNQFTIRMWLARDNYPNQGLRSFDWSLTSSVGAFFSLQTSTNLTSWVSLASIQNDGSVCTYINISPSSPTRFYRVVPQ